MIIVTLLAFAATPAQAYKAGDIMRYVGTDGGDACAVEFTVGKADKLNAKEELIQDLKLYTTFKNDRHFNAVPDQLSTPKIVELGHNWLGVPNFRYVYNHSNPDGFTTDMTSESLNLYGNSLDKIRSVAADYSEGTTFHTRTKGKFGCGTLKPASEAEFRVVLGEVKTLSERQIEKFEAAERLKRDQAEMAESQRRAANEARDARAAEAAKENQEQWDRDAGARQAELDRERAEAGLSPIEHDGAL